MNKKICLILLFGILLLTSCGSRKPSYPKSPKSLEEHINLVIEINSAQLSKQAYDSIFSRISKKDIAQCMLANSQLNDAPKYHELYNSLQTYKVSDLDTKNQMAFTLSSIQLTLSFHSCALNKKDIGQGYTTDEKHKQTIESGGGYSPETENENISNQLSVDEKSTESKAKQKNAFEVSGSENPANEIGIHVRGVTYLYDRSDTIYENGNEINADFYFNKLPKKNNLITVNILGNVFNSVISTDNNIKEYSFVSTNQYDCKEKKARTLNLVSYEKINATGALINSPKFDTSWAPWTKENTERIQQKICN